MNSIEVIVMLLRRSGFTVMLDEWTMPPNDHGYPSGYRWDLAVLCNGNSRPFALVEIHGGTRMKGKKSHSSHDGITRDCKKLRCATLNGCKQLSYTKIELDENPDLVFKEIMSCQ